MVSPPTFSSKNPLSQDVGDLLISLLSLREMWSHVYYITSVRYFKGYRLQ